MDSKCVLEFLESNSKKFKEFLSDFKIGVIVNGKRELTVRRIIEFIYKDKSGDRPIYGILIRELDQYICFDKKSFDYEFKNREKR